MPVFIPLGIISKYLALWLTVSYVGCSGLPSVYLLCVTHTVECVLAQHEFVLPYLYINWCGNAICFRNELVF
jgi:hypothetical protein